MNNNFLALQQEMKLELNRISEKSFNRLRTVEESLGAVKEILLKLKEFVLGYQFKDIDEEIEFFKVIKPEFLRELYYYEELLKIEQGRPLANKESVKAYLNRHVEKVELYYEENRSFYNYHLAEKTDRDQEYFVRGAAGDERNLYTLEIDERFSTYHSNVLARLFSCDMLLRCLQREIYGVDNIETDKPNTKNILKWTDSKVGAIEFLYGLWAHGAFNNGKATLTQVITSFEANYGIDLGNYHTAIISNIRLRKKNVAVYIDAVKGSMIKKFDDLDEFPRG